MTEQGFTLAEHLNVSAEDEGPPYMTAKSCAIHITCVDVAFHVFQDLLQLNVALTA